MIDKRVNRALRPVASQHLVQLALPKPTRGRGTSVSIALQRRRTIREISEKRLSPQALSNLLWAACGVNRKQGPFDISGRTAASASNSQEIDIYVVMEKGIYFYDPVHHRLDPVAAGDDRALAISPGQADLVARAPVQLIYVADIRRLTHTSGFQEPGLLDPEVQKSYYYVDTGLIAGNVYLFAAAEGLASWFHNCNKDGLAAKLELRDEQRILFGQTIGYPANN